MIGVQSAAGLICWLFALLNLSILVHKKLKINAGASIN